MRLRPLLVALSLLLLAAPAAALASAPSSTYPPSVYGEAVDGERLGSWEGGWDEGGEATTYARQWLRCDAVGDSCTPITGADGEYYSVPSSDIGATLRLEVTATNASGSVSAQSAPKGPIEEADAPVSAGPPPVYGSAEVGQTLSGGAGDWGARTGVVSLDFQWRRCDASGDSCSDIAGATSSERAVAVADMGSTLRLRVTATNAYGSDSASSDATAVVPAFDAPSTVTVPEVDGQRTIGGFLVPVGADFGTNIGSPTYGWEWLRCDAAGDDCVSVGPVGELLAHEVTEDDAGKTLRVRVTATNAVGSDDALSEPVAIPAYEIVSGPEIAGDAVLGAELSVSSPGTWNASGLSYAYQWRRCSAAGDSCADIAGETGSTYELVSADLDATVRVAVTATGTRGTSPAVSSDPTSVVALPDAPSLTAVPWIDGDLLVGSTLSVAGGDWGPRTGPLTFEYRWQRCADADGMECEWIDDAESASYVLTAADLGSTMAVEVRAVNGTGSAQAWVGPTDFVAQP